MEKSRSIYYYFGRNGAHDYKATKMDNCILAGRTGAGKSVFLDSTLIRLIQETNPNEFAVYYHDCSGFDGYTWKNSMPENKYIPQLNVDLYGEHEGFCDFQHLTDALCDLRRMAEARAINLEEDPADERTILFIINEYQAYVEHEKNIEWFEYMCSAIMDLSKESRIYLLLSSRLNSSLSDELIQKFGIKVVTPCHEDVSNRFIGSNIAARCKEKYGVVWVRIGEGTPIKLYVPFYPDTWIRKFIGYYSVRK